MRTAHERCIQYNRSEWRTLLPAVSSLRPHVIAVATSEPFLMAAGIVCREDGDRRAAAPRARRATLFGICGTIPVIHPPAPLTRRSSGAVKSNSVPAQPIRKRDGVPLAVASLMAGKGPTEASLELLRKKLDALLEETDALPRRIKDALISESSRPFWPERRRVAIPHDPERRRR